MMQEEGIIEERDANVGGRDDAEGPYKQAG